MKITKLLRGLKDYNIYFEEMDEISVLEECENPYHNYFDMSFSNPEFLKEIQGVFILKKNGKKVYMKEFLPYIYETENEWRMQGDERYVNPIRLVALIDYIKLRIRKDE